MTVGQLLDHWDGQRAACPRTATLTDDPRFAPVGCHHPHRRDRKEAAPQPHRRRHRGRARPTCPTTNDGRHSAIRTRSGTYGDRSRPFVAREAPQHAEPGARLGRGTAASLRGTSPGTSISPPAPAEPNQAVHSLSSRRLRCSPQPCTTDSARAVGDDAHDRPCARRGVRAHLGRRRPRPRGSSTCAAPSKSTAVGWTTDSAVEDATKPTQPRRAATGRRRPARAPTRPGRRTPRGRPAVESAVLPATLRTKSLSC